MTFNITLTIILFIALIISIYNIIVAIWIKAYQLIVLSAIESGLIGILFGLVLSSILFNV